MKFDNEFKEAISHLPSKEKDKLLLRLLKKDLDLANRLYFELVSTNSIEDEREKMKAQIIKKVGDFSDRFYSLGYLNMDIRYLSGEITTHVKKTKDKFGEISLQILLLTEVLKQNSHRIEKASGIKARKLCVAMVSRIYKILLLIHKQHPDMLLEFRDSLKTLGLLFSKSHKLMKTAIYNGLEINWVITANIPEDIVLIHKDLRAQGFLK